MKKINELRYTDLKNVCNPNIFKFETTKELKNTENVIGQERGIRALEFGININVKGYNIYIEGPTGVRKNYVYKKILRRNCKKKKNT